METNCSKFWLGLGLGSIIGAIAYRFSCSSKGKILKEKACHALHQIGGKAENVINSAKDKIIDTGTKVTDKVTHETFNIAEKADDIKKKAHNFADNAKK